MTCLADSILGQSSSRLDPLNLQSESGLTIFCDFDGPLVDVSERYYSTYQLGLADIQAIYEGQGIRLPIQSLTKDQFWRMKRDRIPDHDIALESGLQHDQIDLFLNRVQQIVNQPALLYQDCLQPGVKWALTLLRAQGAQLVLVTLRCPTQAAQILENYGLRHVFRAIYGAQDMAAAYCNSAQQKTQLLINTLMEYPWCGSRPHLAWMIGDTEADILAGQAVGIPTIALTCGIRSQSYLERFTPTRIHRDLLSATHYLIEQHECISALSAMRS